FALNVADQIAAVDGVNHTTGMLRQNVILPSSMGGSTDNATGVNAITVTGLDPKTAGSVRSYTLKEGRFLLPEDTNAALIPESLAIKLDLKIGSKLAMPSSTGTMDFNVVGILSLQTSINDEIYINLPVAQQLLNLPDKINSVEAVYNSGVDAEKVTQTVLDTLGNNFAAGPVEVGNELFASLTIGESAINIIGILSLVMGGFIIFNTFRAVVAERRRDLGMLRALGASRSTILGMFLFESLIQGVIGTLMGLAAGYLLALVILVGLRGFIASFIHMTIGGPSFTISTLVLAVSLGIGITVLSALIPAINASHVTPLEAMRPDIGVSYERAARRRGWVGLGLIVLAVAGLLFGDVNVATLGMVAFLVGLILVAPLMVRPVAKTVGRGLRVFFAREGLLAEGNLNRQPGRAAVTASAMMIGMAIVISLTGMVSTLQSAFNGYLDKSLGADYILMPSSLVLGSGNLGASPELAASMRKIDTITDVTTLRLADSKVNGASLQLIGIDPQTYQAIAGLEFSRGIPNEAYQALGDGRAVILNGIFAAQSGAKLGETITLKTAEGEQPYKVVGIGVDYLNAKLATGYISQANLETDFHVTTDLLIMANRKPGANPTQVMAALGKLSRAFPAFTLLDATSFREQQKVIFSQSINALYAVVIALALPALIAMINTLVINVIERRRELGMLRAVGATRGQIKRMILAESLLLSAFGTGLGIMVGLWLGYVMVGAMNNTGFVMTYYFPFGAVLFALAIGLVFGVLASRLPARQAAEINIIEAIRYE
ncbi:MAG: ABC transporter permease, partial [Anaerolineaceae bacterium]|nr:ABC transporter permease [Anaerolineaceae bacterium]